MTLSQLHESSQDLRSALRRSHGKLSDAISVEASALDDEERDELVALRYASMDWVTGGDDRWLAVARDGITSALIHEEDHLRVQSILPGLQIDECLSTATTALRSIEPHIEFAYRHGIGWLTTSIPNCGTGMRVGVLMHLPALQQRGMLDDLSRQSRSEGLTVRGLYGEGTDSPGGFMQLSNATAFGSDPWPIAQKVSSAAMNLAILEKRARRILLVAQDKLREDALSAYQQLMDSDPFPREILEIVSTIRLAIAEGVIDGCLEHTAEWVAIAGAIRRQEDRRQERFAAMRNAAQLRAKLRSQIPQVK
jgi:protein arginine kinase